MLIVLFYVIFVCKCVLYYCHRVSTELQLTNISYHIIYHIRNSVLSFGHTLLKHFTECDYRAPECLLLCLCAL